MTREWSQPMPLRELVERAEPWEDRRADRPGNPRPRQLARDETTEREVAAARCRRARSVDVLDVGDVDDPVEHSRHRRLPEGE